MYGDFSRRTAVQVAWGQARSTGGMTPRSRTKRRLMAGKRKMWRRILIRSVLVMLLAGFSSAARGPSTYEELARLQSLIGREVTPEAFCDWVAEAYRLPTESIAVKLRAEDHYRVVEWTQRGRCYTALLDGNVIARIGFEAPMTSAERVVAALGEPGEYRAEYKRHAGGHELSLRLVFPEQGIQASGSKFYYGGPVETPSLDGRFGLRFFVVMRPASAEGLLEQMWGDWPPLHAHLIKEYKPWPGTWGEIDIQCE